jgi:hypothetical protein
VRRRQYVYLFDDSPSHGQVARLVSESFLIFENNCMKITAARVQRKYVEPEPMKMTSWPRGWTASAAPLPA